MEEIIWRGMTRAQLDAAYNNTAAVRNSADKLADWTERSREGSGSAKRTARSGIWQAASESDRYLSLRKGARSAPRLHPWRLLAAQCQRIFYLSGGRANCTGIRRGFCRLYAGPRNDPNRNRWRSAHGYPLVARKRTSVRHSQHKADCFRLVGWRTPNGHGIG